MQKMSLANIYAAGHRPLDEGAQRRDASDAALKATGGGPSLSPPISRGANADRLAALDREIAKHRPAPLSDGRREERASLERELRASASDTADEGFDKALGRELLKQFGPGKAAEFLNRAAGEHANDVPAAQRSSRVLAAALRR
jgi:hypothetical protein